MKQRLLLAACATVLIAACSDRDEAGSDNPTAPGIVAFSHQSGSCSFRDAYASARDYFSVNTDRNTVRSLLQTAEGAGVGTSTRDNALWAVVENVARVGGDPALSGDPLRGADLVGEVFECGGAGWNMTDHRAFRTITANALTDGKGGFATVGTSAETLGDANADYAYTEDGKFAFGLNDALVPSPDPALTWSNSVGRAVVIMGQVNTDTDPSPVNFGLTYVGGLVYRVNLGFASAPATGFFTDDKLAVEFCSSQLDAISVDDAAKHRVGRLRSSGQTLLQEGEIDDFPLEACQPPMASAFARPSFFARALDNLFAIVRPAPLQAMMFVPPWSGSSGGQGTSFDDGGFYTDYLVGLGDNVTVSVPTIDNQVVGTEFSIPFTATAGTGGVVKLENVQITIAIAGNQGAPASIIGNGCSGTSCTRFTDETGLADFRVTFTKAGGYTLSVAVVFAGFEIMVEPITFQVAGLD